MGGLDKTRDDHRSPAEPSSLTISRRACVAIAAWQTGSPWLGEHIDAPEDSERRIDTYPSMGPARDIRKSALVAPQKGGTNDPGAQPAQSRAHRTDLRP